MKEARDNRKKRWSGRTLRHGRHRRSVPLGNVRVECITILERCRRMSVPCDGWHNPKKGTSENVKTKAMGV